MAQMDLEHAQTASSREEMGELLRALQEHPKQGIVREQQLALRGSNEKGAEEKGIKDRAGDEMINPPEVVMSILPDEKEEAIQRRLMSESSSSSVSGRTLVESSHSDLFMRRVDAIGIWMVAHRGELPKRRSDDATERTLAKRYKRFKIRCTRDVESTHRKLVPWKKAYFRRLEQLVEWQSVVSSAPAAVIAGDSELSGGGLELREKVVMKLSLIHI